MKNLLILATFSAFMSTATCQETCSSGQFQCAVDSSGNVRCIEAVKVCDGVVDCPSGDDEANRQCVPVYYCSAAQFSCGDGTCIPIANKCDHNQDCANGFDEGSFCGYVFCYYYEFTCGNGRCIDRTLLCNNNDDCRDNSDEAISICSPTCGPNDFVCGDDCIPDNKLCDGNANCEDGTDESACGINECNTPGVCHHICVDTPASYRCDCNRGYKLKEDGVTCEDINECVEEPWVCSQTCVNSVAGYTCGCNSGYMLKDFGSCIHTDSTDPYLLFSNDHYIRRIGLTGDDYQLVADEYYLVAATDFDLVRGELYSIDYLAQELIRSKLDGSARHVIISHDIDEGEGLAVDWIGRKIYWTDRGLDRIDVANLDGTSRKTIIRDNLFDPRGITVDPRNGYLYWSDWGLRPYIGRAGMDGTGAIEFHDDLVGWPNALTICFETDKLYWADAHLDHIVYSNLDGTDITLLLDEGVGHPFAVTVFEDYIYWTDWNLKTVNRANKLSGLYAEILATTLQRPFDIHVVHPLRQDSSIHNPCGTNNGGCSHLCLLAPTGISGLTTYSCACPNNFVLNADLRTCEAQCTNQQFKCNDDDKCIPSYWVCDGELDCHDGSDEYDDCPPRICTPGQFQCNNGECTLSIFTCDGEADCSDNSDESHCATAECNPWEFRCNNGQCIEQTLVCQQKEHCDDGSDEHLVTCNNRNCSDGYFQCANGYCIPDAWFCDLDNDCGDNSDEPLSVCQSGTCPTGWYSCINNYRCIPEYAVCDGRDQCRSGGSDEFADICRERTCSPGEFRCNNNICIPLRWYCDFDHDCGDGSDELYCTDYRNCSESEHRCGSGRCVPWYKICDINVDCEDGSDELKCNEHQCGRDFFQCDSGHCIPDAYLCDGFVDCFHGDDEAYCGDRDCEEDEFNCNNNVCIPFDYRCDGDDDCGDNSDELLCGACPAHKFTCKSSGTCIHNVLKCNGYKDCPDGSDEMDDSCAPPAESCEYNEFKCENSRCVPLKDVCNTFDDCDDNSDEKGCHKNDKDVNECETGEANCERVCTDLEEGYACSCGDGFILSDADRINCLDYNECNDNPCHQVCVNTKGSYSCECAVGYVDASTTGIFCVSPDGNEYLIYSDGPLIRRYYFNSKTVNTFVSDQGRIEDLDYDVTQAMLYWIDSDQFEIKRAKLDGADEGRLQEFQNQLIQPKGLACDWVAGNIYWTDWGDRNILGTRRRRALTSKPSITVANSDGSHPRTLIDEDLEKPFSIVVNPAKGLIYWADQGEHPKVEVAWMTGENREELVTRDLIEPTGLAIDFANYQSVYFADRKEDLIFSMNFDGSNLKAIKGGELFNPYQIDVFATKFYWSSSSTKANGQILSADKLMNEMVEPVVSDIGRHSALKIFHKERYPSFSNPCSGNRCSHLCLIIPKSNRNDGYQCACPDGYGFVDDINCVKGVVECNSNPCFHGGTCTQRVSGYQCICPLDYDGINCEHRIACDCGNGICTENNQCKCDDGTVKDYCHAKLTDEVSHELVAILSGLLAFAIIAIVCIILFFILRKKRRPVSTSAVSYRTGPNVANVTTVSNGIDDGGIENRAYETVGAMGGGIDEKVPIDEKVAHLPPDLLHVVLAHNHPIEPPPAYTPAYTPADEKK